MDSPQNGSRLPHQRVPSVVRSQQEQAAAEEARPRAARAPGRDVRTSLLAVGIPALVALAGIAALATWLLRDRQQVAAEARVPMERPAEAAAAEAGPTGDQPAPSETAAAEAGAEAAGPAAGTPAATGATSAVSGPGTSAPALPGSWPRFRGPNADNISPERVGLARSWGSGGPKRLWAVSLGQGYAGPAVDSGRVYVLDYDESAKADVLRCLSLADGQQLWGQAYSVAIKPNHGISRTVPAVAGGYVVTIGPKGHVMCCKADTGQVLWGIDLVKNYGAKVPSWYNGQCPLIDGGKAIIAPGGSAALIIAVDCATGKVVWQTPNPRGWQMTHTSVVPMALGGQKTYVYTASGGVVGVSASDGSILWEHPGWIVKTANAPSPVPIGDGRIFLCGGYGAGSRMIKVAGDKVSTVFNRPEKVFGSHHHTPILYKDHLYGVSIRDKQLVCLDLNGNRVWSSGHTVTFGLGPYLIAEGMIFALAEDGTLRLAEATASGYTQLAEAKVLDGSEAWGPLALAGGRLICRDLRTMVCLDVKST